MTVRTGSVVQCSWTPSLTKFCRSVFLFFSLSFHFPSVAFCSFCSGGTVDTASCSAGPRAAGRSEITRRPDTGAWTLPTSGDSHNESNPGPLRQRRFLSVCAIARVPNGRTVLSRVPVAVAYEGSPWNRLQVFTLWPHFNSWNRIYVHIYIFLIKEV